MWRRPSIAHLLVLLLLRKRLCDWLLHCLIPCSAQRLTLALVTQVQTTTLSTKLFAPHRTARMNYNA